MSRMLRRWRDRQTVLPVGFAVNECFGSIGEQEQLALQAFIAGEPGVGPAPRDSNGDGWFAP
jgi:hypothetical protein